jgi:two-component system phosphate regulon sensor histidine kinase PhoR
MAGERSGIDALCKGLGRDAATRITVMLPSGEVVGDSEEKPADMENHATQDRPEMMAALDGEQGLSTRYSSTLEKEMMYLAVPLKAAGEIVGVVRTSVPATSIEDALGRVHRELALAGLAVAGIAALVSLLVSRRISHPLEEMKLGARRFAHGNLQSRLAVPETDELASLAEAMNQMAAQLDERLRTITRERNEHEAILASMAEGVLAVDTEERLITINQAAAQMLGIRAEPQGRTIQEAVRNPALQKFVAHALSAASAVEGEEIAMPEATTRVLKPHGAPLRDAGGNRFGAVVVLNDITQLRRLENVRRDFVANVSHELRTPITSIKGFVETLLDGAMRDADDAGRFLNIIAKQADRLNAIIEDLLLLSRLEEDAEQRSITLQEGEIKPVLDAAVEICGLKAAEKQIAVEVHCDGDLHARINAHLLEQAVVNLIDNAINYGEPGSNVEVGARRVDGEVVVHVRDEGCGIEKDDLPRLFERFYRVDKARSRKLGGTGLGLAIVKHIAQVHGGRVTVESTVGKGSVFSLHLPGE